MPPVRRPTGSKAQPSRVLKTASALLPLKFPTRHRTLPRQTGANRHPIPVTAHPVEPERPRVRLYDAFKVGYSENPESNKSLEKLQQAGFQKDTELSNGNQSVFWHPRTREVIFSIAGTHNTNDLITDAQLGLGVDIHKTGRYQEANDIYSRVKEKYRDPTNRYVLGHSLGGAIARNVAEKNDLVYTYNRAAVGPETDSANVKNYRSYWDAVSFLTAFNKNTKNMDPLSFSPLEAHYLGNLKQKQLFI